MYILEKNLIAHYFELRKFKEKNGNFIILVKFGSYNFFKNGTLTPHRQKRRIA